MSDIADAFATHNPARVPNLFIVGAPKAGTTALHRYLEAHSQVFMTRPKEPNFFNTDHDVRQPARSVEEYMALYEGWGAERYAGEGTVWYLHSTEAARHIKQISPDAKIVMVLRNPIVALYSHHYQILKHANQDILDFEEAFEAGLTREGGTGLPAKYFVRETLMYHRIYLYKEQVQRYLDCFDRSQLLILIYDDLKADQDGTLAKLLDFLGLDAETGVEVERVNPNRQARSQWLNRLVKHQDSPIYQTAKKLVPLKGLRRAIRSSMHSINDKVNLQEVARPPLSAAMTARLQDHFRADIEALSVLLDRDLTHWVTPTTDEIHADDDGVAA
ncbi:MAG: sulfotransferase [Pseudomonadota bacterium]